MKPFELSKLKDVEILLAASNMKTFGGSFAACIGNALIYADTANRRKLVEAFPELVEKYLDPVWKA